MTGRYCTRVGHFFRCIVGELRSGLGEILIPDVLCHTPPLPLQIPVCPLFASITKTSPAFDSLIAVEVDFLPEYNTVSLPLSLARNEGIHKKPFLLDTFTIGEMRVFPKAAFTSCVHTKPLYGLPLYDFAARTISAPSLAVIVRPPVQFSPL